jgi:hypothetical protein
LFLILLFICGLEEFPQRVNPFPFGYASG